MNITLKGAQKVLSTIDAGLVKGLGYPNPGEMCIEAAVCYGLGLPHTDKPICVAPALRSLKIRLNDSNWSSNNARAKGLRRLGLAQLGSKDSLDEKEFIKRVAKLAIQKCVPIALRAAASIHKSIEHKNALLIAANKCEKEGTRQSSLEAKQTAYAAAYVDAAAAAYAAAAYAAAYVDAAAAAYAAAYVDAAAAYAAAADADDAYAYVDAAAADAAYAAADAAYAAADADDAYAAANADDAYASRDKVLSDFAEDVVGILIDMKAPGCQWLYLTEG